MMRRTRQRGLTLVEVLGSLAIGALLFAALTGVALQSTRALEAASGTAELAQDAQFALDRMVDAVRASGKVLVPKPERATTAYSESQRNVLAVTLDPTLDRDGDGFPDADNDRDGRIDEDLDEDATNDGAPGIVGVDDDGDGSIDEGPARDDDEDGASNEDNADGIDNDGDGLVDEDSNADANDDGKAGIKAFDDDGDAAVDEGNLEDDDEDGQRNEDWLDARVFRVVGTTLVERLPDPGAVNGNAFTERTIAVRVSNFRVTYFPSAGGGLPPTLAISLTLAGANGATATVDTRIRLGGAR
ncbi:MAG TPA: prepilin-type N-terminal cleavage/methylation domain-containing protein [Gammaproteobacteria bacterium]|nr:prepilin-type N-terminal cleavage/methylation domain-containing protein [Gammaproteobacteria bacterium]